MKLIIKVYQAVYFIKVIILKSVFGYVSYCKHNPSCSVYTKKMIKRHGTIRGLIAGTIRILTCF